MTANKKEDEEKTKQNTNPRGSRKEVMFVECVFFGWITRENKNNTQLDYLPLHTLTHPSSFE